MHQPAVHSAAIGVPLAGRRSHHGPSRPHGISPEATAGRRNRRGAAACRWGVPSQRHLLFVLPARFLEPGRGRVKLREEGKIEGKLEGKREGLAEGRLRALQDAVRRALEIRHGRYPEGIREAVENIADPAVLDGLLEGAFRSVSIEAFAQNL